MRLFRVTKCEGCLIRFGDIFDGYVLYCQKTFDYVGWKVGLTRLPGQCPFDKIIGMLGAKLVSNGRWACSQLTRLLGTFGMQLTVLVSLPVCCSNV